MTCGRISRPLHTGENMHKVTRGIVLREVNYKDADKILTVFTEDEGKITVSARGARRKSSRCAAASQLLVYSEMTLFSYKGRWSLNEAVTIETFRGLRDDVELLTLGSYFAELLEGVTGEEVPEPELLQLLLNSLYALGELKKTPELVKSAFEIRAMCLSGFEPTLSSCCACGAEQPEKPQLALSAGLLHCDKCTVPEAGISMPLCTSSLAAARYISRCDAKKLFSFSLPEDALRRLCDTSEAYVMTQLERGFRTLDFWHELKLHEQR